MSRASPIDGPTILVASPSASLRSRCSQGLHAFPVCEVDRAAGLRRRLGELKSAVVFLDLVLPGLGGLEGVTLIRQSYPHAKIVVLADHPDERQAVLALLAGARGYCGKNLSASLIKKASERVQHGEVWIPRSVVPLLLKQLTSVARGMSAEPFTPPDDTLDALGPRERQIAELVAGGSNNKDIAVRLNVSEGTVKAHLTSVFRKLNVSDRLRLALLVLGQ